MCCCLYWDSYPLQRPRRNVIDHCRYTVKLKCTPLRSTIYFLLYRQTTILRSSLSSLRTNTATHDDSNQHHLLCWNHTISLLSVLCIISSIIEWPKQETRASQGAATASATSSWHVTVTTFSGVCIKVWYQLSVRSFELRVSSLKALKSLLIDIHHYFSTSTSWYCTDYHHIYSRTSNLRSPPPRLGQVHS